MRPSIHTRMTFRLRSPHNIQLLTEAERKRRRSPREDRIIVASSEAYCHPPYTWDGASRLRIRFSCQAFELVMVRNCAAPSWRRAFISRQVIKLGLIWVRTVTTTP